MKLVELLVETDVSGRQMKVADVVTASVVVAVGVGTGVLVMALKVSTTNEQPAQSTELVDVMVEA